MLTLNELNDFDPERLKSMSREEKLELHTLLDEKERREKEKPDNFTPHGGQGRVCQSKKKIRIVTCANGWGKTCYAVNEALWAAIGYNPILGTYTDVPSRVVVVLDNPSKVEDTWLPELRKWYNLDDKKQLQKQGKPYVTRIVFDNGSTITFMFHLQEPMAFESIEVDFVVFDEPSPRHIWVALFRGGRTKGRVCRFLMVGTPISQAWVRLELIEPWSRGERSDIDCFTGITEENEENLAEGYIASYMSILSPEEREIRLKGQFFDLKGLALAHLFSRHTHVVPHPAWSKENPCVLAIDPHPSKDHVAILLGVDRSNNYYVLKEITSSEVPRRFAQELLPEIEGYTVIDIIVDSLGSAKMTGGEGHKTFIEVLNEEWRGTGNRCRATSFQEKEDEAWIQSIQDLLLVPDRKDNFGQRTPKLRIVEGCDGIILEIETVSWQRHRVTGETKKTLDITRKDRLACLKYAVAANLTHGRGQARVTRNPRTASAYGGHQRRGGLPSWSKRRRA